MKLTQHGSNIVQLTRFPLLFPVSCYLVREDDGLTLIDTGISGSAGRITSAAEAIGGRIVRIALTHAHGDHAGALDALHEQLPNAEILVGERESRLLMGDMELETGEPKTKLRGSYVTAETRPTDLLNPGMSVGSLDVVAAPGHTPGHLAFFDRRDRTLIAGDALQTRGGVGVSGKVQVLFPFPALATWHKPSALTSARALYDLAPARLLVGHGKGVENPLPAMERAICDAARSFEPNLANVT